MSAACCRPSFWPRGGCLLLEEAPQQHHHSCTVENRMKHQGRLEPSAEPLCLLRARSLLSHSQSAASIQACPLQYRTLCIFFLPRKKSGLGSSSRPPARHLQPLHLSSNMVTLLPLDTHRLFVLLPALYCFNFACISRGIMCKESMNNTFSRK